MGIFRATVILISYLHVSNTQMMFNCILFIVRLRIHSRLIFKLIHLNRLLVFAFQLKSNIADNVEAIIWLICHMS